MRVTGFPHGPGSGKTLARLAPACKPGAAKYPVITASSRHFDDANADQKISIGPNPRRFAIVPGRPARGGGLFPSPGKTDKLW
jgi:hypothetical protein